ncbi:hypothetical protein KI387_000893, partial [Taxus chinensis]
LCPPEMNKAKRRHFRLHAIPYALVDGVLFKKDINGVLLRCIGKNHIEKMLEEFHNGSVGGHFALRVTALKIMKA